MNPVNLFMQDNEVRKSRKINVFDLSFIAKISFAPLLNQKNS